MRKAAGILLAVTVLLGGSAGCADPREEVNQRIVGLMGTIAEGNEEAGLPYFFGPNKIGDPRDRYDTLLKFRAEAKLRTGMNWAVKEIILEPKDAPVVVLEVDGQEVRIVVPPTGQMRLAS